MKIGFIGLGKMGSQMVTRLLRDGHEVVVYDHNPTASQNMSHQGAQSSASLDELIEKLNLQIIWLMIPAQFVSETIDELLGKLKKGAIIVDGGNSNWRDTVANNEKCQAKSVQLVDVGVSGGLAGLEHGFSMMAGGDSQAYRTIEPLLQTMAQSQGYSHFGPSGSGHFVKMVHNAVEYGIMESYAEGFEILKSNPFGEIDLADVARVWQHGSIVESTLNQHIYDFLQEDQRLEGLDGKVSETGEARWALEYADEKDIPAWAIKAAFDRRIASQQGQSISYATRFLSRLRNAFGGHSTKDVQSSEHSGSKQKSD